MAWRTRWIVGPFLGVVLGAALSGCGGHVSRAYVRVAEASFAQTPQMVLGPRDHFKLDIYPDTGLSRSYTVSPHGTINHPLIGAVQVAGKTCFEVENDVTKRLGDGYLRDPIVSCTIEKVLSQRVVVIGAVNTTGPIPYTQGMTLIDLISRVGGFGENAAKDRVQLTRIVDGQKKEIMIPLQKVMRGRAPNMMLKPGDVLYVPTVGLIQ